jgi:hypothetical protein
MSPAAAKLLMCICAGSTGAAVVPVVKQVRALARPHPAVHRAVAHRPAPSPTPVSLPMQAPPCPTIAYMSPVGAAGPSLVPTSGAFAMPGAGNGGASDPIGFDRPAAFGPAVGGSTAFAEAPGGGPMVASPPGGVGLPNGALPASSGTPEPAAWGLMIGGFGLVGEALRRRRAVRVDGPQAQAISSNSISALGSPFQSSRLIRPAA